MLAERPDFAPGYGLKPATEGVCVHLERGDEVVLLEGSVTVVCDPELLARLYQVYGEKYGVWLAPEPPCTDFPVTLCLRPVLALGWLESDFPGTATRWRP